MSRRTHCSISTAYTIHQDRYQILHKLGCGGFSTVWLAHDRRDGKDVALKILSSSENAAKEYDIHEAIKQRCHVL